MRNQKANRIHDQTQFLILFWILKDARLGARAKKRGPKMHPNFQVLDTYYVRT